MSMFREPIRNGAFIVSVTGFNSYATNASVPADAVIPPGTVMAKPEDGTRLYVPFTSAVGQEVGGLLVEGVDVDQVAAGKTLRRTILDGPSEVTPQGGRITFPEGADAAATEELRQECVAGLEALGIRVR